MQGAQRGQITSKISEADLIKMLERESERKVDTKITVNSLGSLVHPKGTRRRLVI